MNENGMPNKPHEHFYYCVQWLETQDRIQTQCAIEYPYDIEEHETRAKAFREAARLVAERYRMAYAQTNVKDRMQK